MLCNCNKNCHAKMKTFLVWKARCFFFRRNRKIKKREFSNVSKSPTSGAAMQIVRENFCRCLEDAGKL